MDPAAAAWLRLYAVWDTTGQPWCAGGWGDQPARWADAMMTIKREVERYRREFEAQAEQERREQMQR